MINLQSLASNPALTSGPGLYAVGVVTFLLKDIPGRVFAFSKLHSTTSITVTSYHDSFHAFTEWIEASKYSKKFRTLRINNNDKISAGIGRHFFFYKRRLCWLSRERVDNKNFELEEITVSYLGRDQQLLRDLLQEALDARDTSKKTRIYVHGHGEWLLHAEQEKRALSSVLLSDENKKALLNHLTDYNANKAWYHEHGVPYRTGICLSGPPGTGKTSLVRAICAEYGLKLCTLDLSSIGNGELMTLMSQLERRSLLLIEDIDTVHVTENRETKVESGKISIETLTLGGVLNAIDGVVGSDGRIIVVTTNKISKLDPALLRPGRIDLALELGYMSPLMFKTALSNFFPGYTYSKVEWPTTMTPAMFQQVILGHKTDPDKVLEAIGRFETVEQLQLKKES